MGLPKTLDADDSTNISPEKYFHSLHPREAHGKEHMPVISRVLRVLFLKVLECVNDSTIPPQFLLLKQSPEKIGAYPYELVGDNIIFYFGDNKIRFSLPVEFVKSLDGDSDNQVDFMMEKWTFLINGTTISDNLWYDNPWIHNSRRKPLAIVPDHVEKILKNDSSKVRTEKSLRAKLREAISSIDKKLLPGTIGGPETVFTPRGISKINYNPLIVEVQGEENENQETRSGNKKVFTYCLISVEPKVY